MIRDEPEEPHRQEVRAYERKHYADKEEDYIPRWQVWFVAPFVYFPRRYVFPLALVLFVISLALAVLFYQSPATASGGPMLLAVAVMMGILAAYYGAAWYDAHHAD